MPTPIRRRRPSTWCAWRQSAANKTLVVTFFDVGEGASSGSVKLLKPVDSNLPADIAGCTRPGVKNGGITDCEITGITPAATTASPDDPGPDPQQLHLHVREPGRLLGPGQVSSASGTVTDSTTWTAQVIGDPVRLVE